MTLLLQQLIYNYSVPGLLGLLSRNPGGQLGAAVVMIGASVSGSAVVSTGGEEVVEATGVVVAINSQLNN